MSRIALVSCLFAAACAQNASAPAPCVNTPAPKTASAKGAPATALDPAMAVATVGGQTITASELDTVVGDELKAAMAEYVEKVHQTRKGALEELVSRKLVTLEAKAAGATEEELLRGMVDAKVKKPTEEEIKDAYERFVKPRSQVSFEVAKDRIAEQLSQEQKGMRFREYVGELKAKYAVKLSLPLPEVERLTVAATGPSKGPESAKVTIVEFSDFQCPFCSRGRDSIDAVVKKYGDKVRVVFRHFPLNFHPLAPKAAEAAMCAQDQGKFWQLHDAMFSNQEKLEVAALKQTARGIGLDGAKFDACLDSGEKAAAVQKDMEAGRAARVNGTPAFFINGRSLSGAQPIEAFSDVIDAELAL